MSKIIGLVLVLTLGLISACTRPSRPPLTKPQLLNEITDRKFHYDGVLLGQIFTGKMTFHANRNIYVETDSGIPEGGTWYTKDNKLCLKLVNLRSGRANCFLVYAHSNGTFITGHGFTITPYAPDKSVKKIIY